MTNDDVLDATIRHRHRLIERLERLTEEQWNKASLCTGWRVRDVIGHLVSIVEQPLRSFAVGAVRHRGIHGAFDHFALQTGSRPLDVLLADYRAIADRRFKPPGVGVMGPLTDVLVHTRDVERPLGLEPSLEQPSVRRVLNYLASGRGRGFAPGKRINGLRFEATDMEWWGGSGALLVGPSEALMLAMCGRAVAVADLVGNGVQVLNDRMTKHIPRV